MKNSSIIDKHSLEVIEEIFLTLDVSWFEDENESYAILKIIYDKEQDFMHNIKCDIISKKKFIVRWII